MGTLTGGANRVRHTFKNYVNNEQRDIKYEKRKQIEADKGGERP